MRSQIWCMLNDNLKLNSSQLESYDNLQINYLNIQFQQQLLLQKISNSTSPSAQTLDAATYQQQKKIDYEAALRRFNVISYALVVILLGIIIARTVAAADGDLTTGTIILYALSYGLWWIFVIVGIFSARYWKQQLLIFYQFGLGFVLVFEIIGDIYAFKEHTSRFPDTFIICLMVFQIIMMTLNILRARNLRLLMIAVLDYKINSKVDLEVK